ncbi:acyl-ACP desaturase [Streptomyces sp. NPDC001393]
MAHSQQHNRTEIPYWFAELEPVVAGLLDRHLATTQEWFPHQYVPWGRGCDFDGPLAGLPWQQAQSDLSPTARAALTLSVLTEDNLPSYHHQLLTGTGGTGAWREWIHRWTAEEDRHATAIRAYLHTTRAVDPVALERARMSHMSTPTGEDISGAAGLAYVMIQEQATRVAHRATADHCGEQVCAQLFIRIAQDENLHMVFYRDLFRALLELDPDEALDGLLKTLRTFAMPGRTLPDFASLSGQVAMAGWYDLGVYHDRVITPLLSTLDLERMTGLGPGSEAAREAITATVHDIGLRARRWREMRQRSVGTAVVEPKSPAHSPLTHS